MEQNRTEQNRPEQNQCTIPCNLCGSVNIEELSLIDRDKKYLRTIICKNCGLVWADPRPIDVRKFYEEEYRLLYKARYHPKPKHIYRAGKVSISRYEQIKEYIKNNVSLLDVGSGGGEFIFLMRKLGCIVTGIEPNEGYGRYSISEYNLNVHINFIQDVKVQENSQDIVTMWHILEHTEDPTRILEIVYKWVKQDGYLVIEVPNVESTTQAPIHRFHLAHLYNFNINTLIGVGKKVGLRVVKHLYSEREGNLMVIFQKNNCTCPAVIQSIQRNYNNIYDIVNNHTFFRHYASHYPYVKLFKKVFKMCIEKLSTLNTTDGNRILKNLYKNVAV